MKTWNVLKTENSNEKKETNAERHHTQVKKVTRLSHIANLKDNQSTEVPPGKN